MGITRVVIVGPNLRDQSRGDFHVHAEGCADLRRDRNVRYEDQSWVVEAEGSRDELMEFVAEDIYCDIMAENGDEDASGYVELIHFAPCVK